MLFKGFLWVLKLLQVMVEGSGHEKRGLVILELKIFEKCCWIMDLV